MTAAKLTDGHGLPEMIGHGHTCLFGHPPAVSVEIQAMSPEPIALRMTVLPSQALLALQGQTGPQALLGKPTK